MTVLRYESPAGETLILGKGRLRIAGISGLAAPETKAVYGDAGRTDLLFTSAAPRVISVNILIDGAGLEQDGMRTIIRQIAKALLAQESPGLLAIMRDGIVRTIRAFPEHGGVFSERAPGKTFQEARLGFLTVSPYFAAADTTSLEILYYESSMELPEEGIAFPEDGIELSRVNANGPRKVAVENPGDVPCPVRIQFTGPALNPFVANRTTGKAIKLERALSKDETVRLSTEPGARFLTLERNGTIENGMHCLDLASSFFLLACGTNVLEFGDESPGEGSEAQVSFECLYAGL